MGGGGLGRKFRFLRKDARNQNLEEKPAPQVKVTCEMLSSTLSTGIVVGALPEETLDVPVPEQRTNSIGCFQADLPL